LGNGADFYNARTTMPRYHPFVIEAFRLASKQKPTLKNLLVYGEYFGGYYPSLPAEPGIKKVQKGVAYSTGHHFYAFDVSLDGGCYMDFDEARNLLLAAGFPLVAAPYRRGPLDELLAIDVEKLETSLPALLGHEPSNNYRIAEGIVLRPFREVRFGKHGEQRAVLKKKACAFWEATNQHGMAAKTAATSQVNSSASGLQAVLDTAKVMINENRLRAVISKDPQLLSESNTFKLAGLLTKDILEDLAKARSEEIEALGKDEAVLRKGINFFARTFVTENLVAIREDVG